MRYEPGQFVRLLSDVPDLEVRAGQQGVVCSVWFAPLEFYEVEVPAAGLDMKLRVVVPRCQLCPCEAPDDDAVRGTPDTELVRSSND